MLMAEFYRCWWWERQSPAAALCAAQRWLRDTTHAEKSSHYQAARDERAGWLPPEVAEFLSRLRLLSDGKRSQAGIHDCGAFAQSAREEAP